MSAEDRREQVITAAVSVFARSGYEGATTAAIAEKVGVTQPYLFRLFPTKKDLFLAASGRNMENTLHLMREAAGGKTGHDALEAMGVAYLGKLVDDREWLLMQLQTFAACHDPDIQRQTRNCIEQLWNDVESMTGLPIEDRVLFFAKGMFSNVIAAVGRLDGTDSQWNEVIEALGKHVIRVPDGGVVIMPGDHDRLAGAAASGAADEGGARSLRFSAVGACPFGLVDEVGFPRSTDSTDPADPTDAADPAASPDPDRDGADASESFARTGHRADGTGTGRTSTDPRGAAPERAEAEATGGSDAAPVTGG